MAWNDGVHGVEPWISDGEARHYVVTLPGTMQGTYMLEDLTGDSGDSTPSQFTIFDEKVFFVVSVTLGVAGSDTNKG
jgi:uncharacterized protein affecting Mg2+/Co2+ transport